MMPVGPKYRVHKKKTIMSTGHVQVATEKKEPITYREASSIHLFGKKYC